MCCVTAGVEPKISRLRSGLWGGVAMAILLHVGKPSPVLELIKPTMSITLRNINYILTASQLEIMFHGHFTLFLSDMNGGFLLILSISAEKSSAHSLKNALKYADITQSTVRLYFIRYKHL